MPLVTQTVSIEIEATAQIDAKAQKDGYGVPGSPVWWDFEVVGFAGLKVEIAGVEVMVSDLPEALRNAILEQLEEAADEWKWEGYDE